MVYIINCKPFHKKKGHLAVFPSFFYTLDKIDIDEAIAEYTALLTDDELSSISIFHSGLASAYKKKDRSESFSDSLVSFVIGA